MLLFARKKLWYHIVFDMHFHPDDRQRQALPFFLTDLDCTNVSIIGLLFPMLLGKVLEVA
jgi:hypothetical protein